MATRATYLISSDYGKTMCFYIHYDGYPQGAARYFQNMLTCINPRSGYAGRFFRANELAEFTDSHEAHGDTEYRYTLIKHNSSLGEKLKLLVKYRESFESEEWTTIFHGSLEDFIQEYSAKKK